MCRGSEPQANTQREGHRRWHVYGTHRQNISMASGAAVGDVGDVGKGRPRTPLRETRNEGSIRSQRSNRWKQRKTLQPRHILSVRCRSPATAALVGRELVQNTHVHLGVIAGAWVRAASSTREHQRYTHLLERARRTGSLGPTLGEEGQCQHGLHSVTLSAPATQPPFVTVLLRSSALCCTARGGQLAWNAHLGPSQPHPTHTRQI